MTNREGMEFTCSWERADIASSGERLRGNVSGVPNLPNCAIQGRAAAETCGIPSWEHRAGKPGHWVPTGSG